MPAVEVSLDDSEVLPLYDCAANNRVSLLYLETLKKHAKLGKLETGVNPVKIEKWWPRFYQCGLEVRHESFTGKSTGGPLF